tara:strand:- start:2062 stop:2820 length:759 start_codon:yes stop_codon:yes gene_type:complete
MKLTKQEFIKQPRKAITLIGMSGAGKTYISCQLEKWGWYNYSCDYVIGADYLKDELQNTNGLSAENIGALSVYLGKLGKPSLGGFDLELFKKRQKSYYDAEVEALYAMGETLNKTQEHFVHDSTGSLCEIQDEAVLKQIGEQTMFVYLKTGETEEREVLQRARDYPKPLFFPPQFLSEKLNEYMTENHHSEIEEIVPDDFSRWVFPLLFEARKPKYQRLADLYGVTISSDAFKTLQSSDSFIDIIASHLDDA